MTWHLLAANRKLIENFNQAASTRCSGDDKEKLSTNIRSEYASDFCHDRKSAFKLISVPTKHYARQLLHGNIGLARSKIFSFSDAL